MIMALILDNIAFNKHTMATIKTIWLSIQDQFQVQILFLILLYPLVVMAYLTFCYLTEDFQDISWSNMTVYKMTLGDRLVFYFKAMTTHNVAISLLCFVYFVLVLNFMYALILSVVCARYNEIMMVHHGQKQEINYFNAIFYWMVKQKKTPKFSGSSDYLQDQDITAQECAAYERGFLGY